MPELPFQWTRFTGREGTPAYVDLLTVAAITEARFEDHLIAGARLVLYSGAQIFVTASVDSVFDLVHRARTEESPAPVSLKLPGAPAPSVRPATETVEEGLIPEQFQETHIFEDMASSAYCGRCGRPRDAHASYAR